jgi:DNA invertase Pin-like site-specific DNA recombinase
MRKAKAKRPKRSAHKVRCAIYTRKSSEEGLDQDFNSLDAQREACEAYIVSQRGEGWEALPSHYDDGGFSGGGMERPALKQLLSDVGAGQIDAIVVYKIDRLTRSLSDFVKMVEIFDAREVSFVSVTQSFNTTTSMGRLTLNVLLSFAQFEREVTGERIRDKIAASKKKGMWMGGPAPLGYDAVNRKLIVNREEAKTVRRIYRKYAEVGSVRKLKEELDAEGILSKVREGRNGRRWGGRPFSRGALYLMLQNRIYLGETTHKGNSYPGEHEEITSRDLWEKVQEIMAANRVSRRAGGGAQSSSLLAGILYDSSGNRMTPSHAVKKGKRYRYYLSNSLAIKNKKTAPGSL